MHASINEARRGRRAVIVLALLLLVTAAVSLPLNRARAVLVGAPPESSIPSPVSDNKVFGVTISGGEFGEDKLPGTIFRDYMYPSDVAAQQYFHGHGQTLIRVPFRWERVQRDPLGPLTQADISSLRSTLNAAQQAEQLVILDMHNYGRLYDKPLTTADAGKFADVWSRIAREFQGHPALFGYELMNEPHDLPEGDAGWAALAQAGTDAIRREDSKAWVLVPGYGWQTARFWPENNASLNVTDPTGRLLYAAHQYFDSDYSGSYSKSYDADGAYQGIGVDRIKPFLDWLGQRNARGIFTEYGVPDTDPRWLTVLDQFLGELRSNPAIAGGTYWAAGPWWGSYPLSVEPRNGQDRPQMRVLDRYPSQAASSRTNTILAPAPVSTVPPPAPTATTTPGSSVAYGVLSPDVKMTPAQLQAWRAAGGTHVEVLAAWDQLQPTAGAPLSTSALAEVQGRLDDAKRAGLQVALTLALHYPPAFVQNDVPRFRDQNGAEWSADQASGDNVRDWVWSATGRAYAADFIGKAMRGLNLSAVESIRIGGGNRGELQFPPVGGPPYRFWGYSAPAQTGAGLASGMSRTPLPGYVPFGQGSTVELDTAWSSWYLDSLKNFMTWQIQQFRAAGWQGNLYVLHASWGMRSNWNRTNSGYQEAVAQGQDWERMIAAYANEPNVWPWSTWVDAADTQWYPGQDSDKAPWRKLYEVAAAYGKTAKIRGENTGDQSNTNMDQVFQGPMARGYTGLFWLSWSSLATEPGDTLGNLQRLINSAR